VSVQTTTTALLDPSVPLSGRPSWASHGAGPSFPSSVARGRAFPQLRISPASYQLVQ
jgi:hypothetical protein